MQGVFERYRRLQQYVGWTRDDAERLRRVGPLLDRRLPVLIDDFYAEIERHPETRQVVTGGAAQVERLKGTLIVWLRELFSKTDDEDYVTRRWRDCCATSHSAAPKPHRALRRGRRAFDPVCVETSRLMTGDPV